MLQLWDCVNGENQQWVLNPVGASEAKPKKNPPKKAAPKSPATDAQKASEAAKAAKTQKPEKPTAKKRGRK